MKRWLLSALFLMPTLSAGVAKAADGSTGCGPGWYVFKENSLVSSSLRSTTNGFLWPVTTLGMTFGTSNCAKHKIVLDDKRGLHFATMNRDMLMVEMAAGEGRFLEAFAGTMGCPAGAAAWFGSTLRQQYGTVWTTGQEDAETVVGSVRAIIGNDVILSTACGGAA